MSSTLTPAGSQPTNWLRHVPARHGVDSAIILTLLVCCAMPAGAQVPGMHLVGSEAVVPMDAAYLGLNCNHLEIQGQLWLGSGEIDGAHDVHVRGVLDGGTGLIDVGGNWTNAGTFIAATSTVRLSGGCKSTAVVIEGPTTFCKLDLAGSGIQYRFAPGSQIVVECELDLGTDNVLSSSGPGETYIALGPRATVVGTGQLNGVRIGSWSSPTAIPFLGPMGLAGLVLLLVAATVCQRRRGCDGVGTRVRTRTSRGNP